MNNYMAIRKDSTSNAEGMTEHRQGCEPLMAAMTFGKP